MHPNRNKNLRRRNYYNYSRFDRLKHWAGSLTFSNKLLLSAVLAFVFACITAFAVFNISSNSTIRPTISSEYYQTYANYQQSRLTLDDYANALLQLPGSPPLGNAISADKTSDTAPKPDNPSKPNTTNNLSQLPQVVLPRRPTGEISTNGAQLADKDGTRYFIAGVNYEGHTDRAWKMWDKGMFDPALIDSDFALAAAGGYNTLRIFVRDSLRDDLALDNFSKLDKVVELSERYGLRLLITFADYDEANLTKLMAIDTAVAKHYANSPVVLGYDLKNEPQFADIAAAIYPAGVTPLLQTDALIKSYGERVSRAESERWRTIGTIPAFLDPTHAYFYANAYTLYQEYLGASDLWVTSHEGKSVVDFPNAPEAGKWQGFLNALNATLQSWIDVRQNAIRAGEGDKTHKPITIGFDRLPLAALSAQNSLGFVSLHRYTGEGYRGLKATLDILDSLHRTFGGKPLTLEEFGYSNNHGSHAIDAPVSMQITAQAETAIWLHLYSQGFGGGFKWMLTNYPPGYTPEQNNFGLLDDQTRPKPAYYAARAVMAHTLINQNPEGGFTNLDELPGNAVGYNFTSPNAVFSDADNFSNNRLSFQQVGHDPWGVWWPANGLGWIYISSTNVGQLNLNLKSFFPAYNYNSSQPPTLRSSSNVGLTLDFAGDNISFQTAPGAFYVLSVPASATPFAHAEALGGPASLYFPETNHNLSNAFKNYWQQQGGVNIFGFPISEEFHEAGHTVQYFERARFEYHPELAGTDLVIQLGLLGKQATDTLVAKTPLQNVPTPQTNRKLYFTQTSHTLANGFKAYWEQHGGLKQFGYPISEEFQEVNALDGKTYIVQYFERARFEYRAELKGTTQEIQLGLLGLELVKRRGWLS